MNQTLVSLAAIYIEGRRMEQISDMYICSASVWTSAAKSTSLH